MTEADATAARAVYDGVANAGQQRRFFAWMLAECCRMNGASPDLDHGSLAHHDGRRFVGHELMRAINPAELEKIKARDAEVVRQETARAARGSRVTGQRKHEAG